MTIILRAEPLTRDAFAPFGDVIEAADADRFAINQGFAERFNDLARIDITNEQGQPTSASCGAHRSPCRFR